VTNDELLDQCARFAAAEREYIAAKAEWEIASRELNQHVGRDRMGYATVPGEVAYAAQLASERYDVAAERRDAELDELKHAATVWLAEREAAAIASSSVDNSGGGA